MSRPPEKKPGQKTKSFIATGIMTDMDGNKLAPGDKLELTQAQAKYFQALNAISIDMEATFDDEPEATEADADDGDAKSSVGVKANGVGKSSL